jgi:hypothetical protein
MKAQSKDPSNGSGCWYACFFYFNKGDPRIIVPKRIRSMGWTINWARPMAIPLSLMSIAVVLAPFKVLEHYDIKSGGAYILTSIAVLIGLITFCSWMSNPSRLEKKQNL